MNTAFLSLLLDVSILICLGFTIFYAIRLSKSLNGFRQYRKEFQDLINSLNYNVQKAQEAIDSMKKASQQSGGHLQELIDEGRLLSDEMQMINDTANSLAGRLEGLAKKGRESFAGEKKFEGMLDEDHDSKPGRLFERDDAPDFENNDLNAPSFFIRDPDMEDEGHAGTKETGPEEKPFQSEAERQLYEALQARRKSGSGGV